MKKILAIAAFASLWASAGPVVPSSIVFPTAPQIESACATGYADGEGGRNNYFANQYGIGGGKSVTTKLGSVYVTCYTDAKNLKAKKAPTTLYLSVLVRGTVKDSPSKAADWAAALSFEDASGKELLRLAPDLEDEGKGWKISCSSSPCTWSGSNIYLFATKLTPEQEATIRKSARVQVLVSRGAGVEKSLLTEEMLGVNPF